MRTQERLASRLSLSILAGCRKRHCNRSLKELRMSRKLIELVIDEKEGRTQAVHLAQIDEEQRTLVAPALIPDLKIVRFDKENDEEYDVYFSKDTVKQASELFLKTHRTNNHTWEHAEPVEGVSVVESWIVQDAKMDKANLYGFNDLKEGTWMVRAKVDNPDVWNKIRAGETRGLSIEGYFLDRVEKFSKEQKEKGVLQTIVDKVVGKRSMYKEAKLTTGDVLVTESDDFSQVGVYSLGDEGEPVGIDNGKYTTEAGVELEVYDGVLIEYDEVKAIEEKAETPAPVADPVDMSAMKIAYYKALLKTRSRKALSKSRKSATLSAMKETQMSKRHAEKVVTDALHTWGDDGYGLYNAITDVALEVFPELEQRVYEPMMDAARSAEDGDMDAVRDYLAEAYDEADNEVRMYIDALLTAVGTLEQYY